MMRFVPSPKQQRDIVAAARCLRSALPDAPAMQAAALDHMRKRGGVSFPIEIGAPVPEGYFDHRVLEMARTGVRCEPFTFPHELTWHVQYVVPVRIATPWGPVSVPVNLQRAYDGETWTCSSAPLDRRSLRIRAQARDYRFVLLVMANDQSTKEILKQARKSRALLHSVVWDLDGVSHAEHMIQEPFALRKSAHPSSRAAKFSAEYSRFVGDRSSRRTISSRAAITLTPAQEQAANRFKKLATMPLRSPDDR